MLQSQNKERKIHKTKNTGNVYERERERDLERLGEADLFLFGDLEGDLDFFGEYDRRGLRERDLLFGVLLLERDRLRLGDLPPPPPLLPPPWLLLSALTRMNATSPLKDYRKV